ncbi:MAG: leucine-rich repeat domain-containing protein, partial [Clostridia bacterium]|nr:leucine-rich repeat domain-containing protein [Clostridia bacterium]
SRAFEKSPNVVLHVTQGSGIIQRIESLKLKYVTYAYDGVVWQGTCGENAKWELYSNGTLKITGSGAMADYETIGSPWYQYRNAITSVEIGKDITYIGKFNFYLCSKLQTVTFAEDGALTTIGWGAFGNTGLVEITIPATVKLLDRHAFYFNYDLSVVNFAENSQLEKIDAYAFRGTTALSEVNGIPAGAVVHANAFLESAYVIG